MKTLKVTHICTTLKGGAGLAAARIIRSTKALGVDARVLVAKGERSENVDIIRPVMPYSRIWIIKMVQRLLSIKGLWPMPVRIRKKINEELSKSHSSGVFTSPVTLYKNVVNHPWVQNADIIHLHWIGDFVDYESFFTKVEKPIVWTVHDQNPGFGGFHYQIWYDNAKDSFKALDDEFALLKKRVYKSVNSMTLVAISSFMQKFFRNNSLLCDFPFALIFNGVDEDRFAPISRACAREALGLSANSVVFLFVANNIHLDVKGLKVLIEALEILKMPDVVLLCLGDYKVRPRASFEVRCDGFVGNERLLSLYYSSANYFVMPSLQESFGQTPLEAMTCGTPVIAFPTGVIPELVNNENGVICKDFTVDALVDGIKFAMNRDYNKKVIYEDVVNRFSCKKIGTQYLELYNKVLENADHHDNNCPD